MKISEGKEVIKPYSFIIVAFTILFIEFLFLGFTTNTTNFTLFLRFWSCVTDSTFFIIPLLFLKGRSRYIYIIVPFLIAILIFSNVLFYRHFNDLIPAPFYFSSSNLNSFVIDSALASIRWYDWIVILLPVILLCFLIRPLQKYVLNYKINKKICFYTFALLVFSSCINIAGNYHKIVVLQNRKYSNVFENLKILFSSPTPTWFSWETIYDRHNFLGYSIYCCFTERGKKIELNDFDYIHIKKFIKENSQRSCLSEDYEKVLDSIPQKNLIMIVVESWPYKTLELDSSFEFMPFVMSLLREERVIIKKARKLTGVGKSSDAQLMYNTGLLPLKTEPFVPNFAFNDFPSLAKALGYSSFEVIGEDSRIWSHYITTHSYGFDRLVEPQKQFISDSLIFENAMGEILKTKVPFFSFITTLTMHEPYTESHRVKGIHINGDFLLEERDKIYLEKLKYFDRYLEKFINNLKKGGFYKNSILVVVGDHPIGVGEVSEMLEDDYVPVIILNSPLQPYKDVQMTQIDLFPSILDIMGIKEYYYLGENYRGLGKSIFDINIKECRELPEEEAYEVSNMIIRGK